MSQEFSRTENCILDALARLDDFLMNPPVQGHSGTTPEASGNALGTSQGTNENNSQSYPHPEAAILHNQMTQISGPENGHDMVTGVHEEVTYCSPSLSPAKQKKIHSSSQPQFRFENTLRQLKQTTFLWPFSRWQLTTILQFFIKISENIPNCQNRSLQRCP